MASFLESIKKVFAGKHKGALLGIDIGSSSIKIVLLAKTEEKVSLMNYGEVVLGPRAGVSAGQATNLPPEKIAEALSEILKEAGITPLHSFFSISFSASLLSVAELPDVGNKELESMVPIEARRYIPVPISEVSLDWWALPKRKKEAVPVVPVSPTVSAVEGSKQLGRVEVIIAAIHNDVLAKYDLIKRGANIPPATSHFEIEIFSTLRAVVGRDLSPILVIDIGAGSTKLVLVDDGVVRGSHIVSMGGQDITLALARSQGISSSQAEEIKCRVGMVGEEEGRDVLAVAEIILANIMNEAVRFVENYERKYETNISKVILVGGGARLAGLEKIVAQKFPKALVALGDPFARVDTPAFLAPTLKELSPGFAVALGIALKGLEE
ncbi:MAG: pilus assembly protein PilM [Patescibacteria group bacterium]